LLKPSIRAKVSNDPTVEARLIHYTAAAHLKSYHIPGLLAQLLPGEFKVKWGIKTAVVRMSGWLDGGKIYSHNK
jgi:hypothetical protein